MNKPEGDIPASRGTITIEPDALLPGQMLGDYKVMRALFYSPLGSFYLLHNSSSGNLSCGYVFPQAVAAFGQFPQRFHDFSENLLRLSHPNILQAKRPDIVDGRYVIFYDSIEGVSVENYLEELSQQKKDAEKLARQSRQPFVTDTANAGPRAPQPGTAEFYAVGLSSERARLIMEQVATVLKLAHDQNIHHFLLTPCHLILGPNDTIQVWGLGLYELMGEDLVQRILAQGTPAFKNKKKAVNPIDILPPEIRRGGRLDARADIYECGLLAYQLITGLRLGLEYIAPTEILLTIPKWWDDLIASCLQNDPASRPPTCAALVKELQSHASTAQATGSESKSGKTAVKPNASKGKIAESTEKTGPRHLLRLIAIGLFGIVTIGVAVKSFLALTTEEETTETKMIRRVDGQTYNFQVKVAQPTRLNFSGSASGSAVVPPGVNNFFLPKGKYKLTADAPNFIPWQQEFEIGAEPIQVELKMQPNYGELTVMAPDGSRIYIITANGLKRYVATIEGDEGRTFNRHLFARAYDFVISKPGYIPQTFKAVQLSGTKPTLLEAILTPLPASLRVLSTPTGATITISMDTQSNNYGVTPSEIKDLPVLRNLQVTLTHPLYRTRIQQIVLQPGQSDTLDFGVLERKTGNIDVKVLFNGTPDPRLIGNMNVKLDDTLQNYTGQPFVEVPTGNKKLTVVHPDYQMWEESILVTDQETTTVTVNLQPKPGLVSVLLGVDLPFEFVVDGQPVAGSGNVFPVPPNGEHAVEVRIRDYFTSKQMVNLRPNQRITWSLTPVRIPPPATGTNFTVPYVDTTMLWIAPGSFKIGSPLTEQGRLPNENDGNNRQPNITFTRGFWMSQYEITQRDYQVVMGENPSQTKNWKNPVENVTWYEAEAFTRKINEQERKANRLPEGYVYRLPAQSEWEYACRAGTVTPFSWGETADPTNGNFKGIYPRGSSGDSAQDLLKPVNVGSYPPNPWGLYDMHGNVKEWCIDPFNERYPSVSSLTDWFGEKSGKNRPVRGGGWDDPAAAARSAARDRMNPTNKTGSVGFRIVLAPEIK